MEKEKVINEEKKDGKKKIWKIGKKKRSTAEREKKLLYTRNKRNQLPNL